MTNNDLLRFFVDCAPGFGAYWESDDNLSRSDDGAYTVAAVCSEFSHYFVSQRYFLDQGRFDIVGADRIDDESMKRLFAFVEENIGDSVEDEDLHGALCACLLENIAQTRAGDYAKRFMGRQSLAFFNVWHEGYA